jgi:hypothetical protein
VTASCWPEPILGVRAGRGGRAVVWTGLIIASLRQGPRCILADARGASVGPFLAAPVMTAYVLAEAMLERHAPGTAHAIVIAFLVVGLRMRGLLTAQWLTGGLQQGTFGPAFFLPGIGIGFVGAGAAATAGLQSIAELFVGIAIATWVRLSSIAVDRVFYGPRLAPLLIGAIAARTIVAGARRELLPSPRGTAAVALSRLPVAAGED